MLIDIHGKKHLTIGDLPELSWHDNHVMKYWKSLSSIQWTNMNYQTALFKDFTNAKNQLVFCLNVDV